MYKSCCFLKLQLIPGCGAEDFSRTFTAMHSAHMHARIQHDELHGEFDVARISTRIRLNSIIFSLIFCAEIVFFV
jgi:hypothetical protein